MASTSRPALARPPLVRQKWRFFGHVSGRISNSFVGHHLNSERVDDHLLRSQIASKRFQVSNMAD